MKLVSFSFKVVFFLKLISGNLKFFYRSNIYIPFYFKHHCFYLPLLEETKSTRICVYYFDFKVAFVAFSA